MAVTNEKTDIFTNLSAAAPIINRRPAIVQFVPFIHTQGVAAGDINSTIEVWRIPSGAALYLHMSTIKFTAYGAARVLSLGYRAYTEADGTAVVAALTALFSALDVSAAGFKHMIEAPTLGAGQTNGIRIFKGSADLVLQVTGGTIPAGAVTSGVLAIAPAGT